MSLAFAAGPGQARGPLRFMGPVLGLLTGGLYFATMSPGAYPGQSATLIVQHTGLMPFAVTANPLWDIAIRCLASIPMGGMAFRLNLFSVLCGAAAVWLLYELVSRAVYMLIEVTEDTRRQAETAARLAGATAAMFLAVSIPFWIVSTRAHTAAFDMLLLFGATRLLIGYMQTRREVALLLFALVYGMGMAEFATFIALAPLFLLGALIAMWKVGELRPSLLVKLAACGALGLSVYFLAAARLRSSEAYALLEYRGYWHILRTMLRDQYLLIRGSLPQVGWLLVSVTSVAPVFAIALVARRALNQERDWTYYILHLVLTAIAVAVLFNVNVSPWRILGMGRLLVMPYVLLGCAFGYLAAYWYLIPETWWGEAARVEGGWVRRTLGATLGALAVLALPAAAVLNCAEAEGRSAAAVNRYARAVLAGLGGREYLITDGSIDNNLMIAARDLQQPVKLINSQIGGNRAYMKHISAWFPEPRLKSMLQVGMVPFLQEWLSSDTNIDARVAVQAAPDLWLFAGRTPIPHELVFVGAASTNGIDARSLMETHRKTWKDLVPPLGEVREGKGPLARFAGNLLRHTSLVANNLGVLMADLGQDDLAFEAYTESRKIYSDNLSAFLNLYAMVKAGYKAPNADEIQKEFERLSYTYQKHRHFMWSLARVYGYVRTPDSFANLGWTWALSGYPGMAVAGYRRAMELGPEQRTDRVKQAMATLYLVQDLTAESEALYGELLAKNPNNGAALLGMARLEARRKDFPKAVSYLQKAEAAGVPKPRIALETAAVQMMAGNIDRARILLQELVETSPDLAQAWLMFAGVLVQQKEFGRSLDDCIAKLTKIKGQDFSIAVVQGEIALAKNEAPAARKHFEQALALRPNSIPLIELMLKLDMMERKRDIAEIHVRRLLTLDPDHPLANYVLGTLQIYRKEYALAEDSMKRSMKRERSPEALNDLAWLLQMRGAYKDAEQFVREAIQINNRMYPAWDTLGTVLMKLNLLDEAEDALKRAASMAPEGRFGAQVNLVEIYAKRGDAKKTLEMIQNLLDRGSELSMEDRETLHRIRSEMRTQEGAEVRP